MHTNTCANCNYHFQEGDIYCSRCSQKADTHKLTVGHLFHELFHAVTHADKGVVLLVKHLAIHPGKVAREYAAGKRKKYFNPFTFVLICLSIFVLINSTFHVLDTSVPADPAVLKQLPTKEAQEKYLGLIRRTAEFNHFITNKTNLLYLLAIPLYASILWLFFRRKSFAEHLVANMYFNAFLALFSSLILMPLLTLAKGTPYQTFAIVLLFAVQIGYLSWAYYDFLGLKQKRSVIKVLAAVVLILIIWTALTGAVALYYVFRENAWAIVKVLSKQYIGANF